MAIQEEEENQMKYFVTEAERKGNCYHEFLKGKWDGETFGRKDSLYLHDDVLNQTGLNAFLSEILPGYDPFGPTEVTQEQWETVCLKAKTSVLEAVQVIQEITPWVEDNFKTEPVFTILGL